MHVHLTQGDLFADRVAAVRPGLGGVARVVEGDERRQVGRVVVPESEVQPVAVAAHDGDELGGVAPVPAVQPFVEIVPTDEPQAVVTEVVEDAGRAQAHPVEGRGLRRGGRGPEGGGNCRVAGQSQAVDAPEALGHGGEPCCHGVERGAPFLGHRGSVPAVSRVEVRTQRDQKLTLVELRAQGHPSRPRSTDNSDQTNSSGAGE
jgi:hypothetical protein